MPDVNNNETEDDPALGALETDIMKLVWDADWVAVRDIYERLRLQRSIAYTTVMTVMTRLYDKGMLDRRKVDRAYVYQAKQTRMQVARNFMRKLVERMFDGQKSDALAALLEGNEELDKSELEAMKKQLDDVERTRKPKK
jgi:predicted transcriptional regulator